MANMKYLNTRVQLKYDKYENWSKAENQKDLLPGEIAIAYLGSTHTTTTPDNGTHPVLFKVGPGKFNDLPWASALAADVYAWAKKESPDWNDFPALPIEVIDNGTGKFVTDIEYTDNKITISRANVVAADIADAPWATKDTVTTVAAGTGVEVTSDNAEDPTYTVSHANTSDVADVAAADRTYVKALTFDEFGHVTAVQTGTETVADTNTVTTVRAGSLMGEIKDEGKDGNHYYVINGKDWSGEIATALADAKKYADDNDTDTNTAHTHTAGDGLKLTGNGGIDGVVDYSLNLALKLESGNIVLHDKDDATKVIATLDAAELLEDSYLNDVDIVGNELQFTWKMDDGSTKTDKVDLTHLVDVYSGETEGTVKVEVDNYKISAEVIAGSLTNDHVASNAAIAETKLAQDVQDALALARTALQSVEHPDYTDEFAGKKDKQTAYAAEGSTAKTITKVEQNENGEVTVTYGDIAFPAPPVVNDGKFTVSGTGALTGTGSMTANQAGDTTATLDVADKGITTAKIADHAVGAHQTKACQDYTGDDAEVWVFCCGSASTLI